MSSFLLTIASRIVPQIESLDSQEKGEVLRHIQKSLLARSPSMQKQFDFFLSVIRWLPLVCYGRPFDRLPAEKKDTFLLWLQDCPVALVCKGFWGLKTLMYLGYYGRPELGAKIGYVPSFKGNTLLSSRMK